MPCYQRSTRNQNTEIRAKNRNAKSTRKIHIKCNYGLSVDFIDAIFNAQRGRCTICDRVMRLLSSSRLGDAACIDHDHQCCPGRKSCGLCFRGLICSTCNKGLGYFDDDPIVLLKAIEYLLKISFQE
jgi:hypothetical protein